MKFLGLKYFHLVNEEKEASKKIKNVPQIIQIIVGWDFSPFLQVLYSFHYTTSAKKKKISVEFPLWLSRNESD